MSEEERFAEKQAKFHGSAKIHFRHLVFHQPNSQISADLNLDPKNVQRLTQIFRLEGCLRLDLEHHVPAIISDDILAQSLYQSGVRSEDLRRRGSPPTLDLPEGFGVLCLHGKHRIAAAKNVLLPGNKWWTVDLYSNTLEERVVRDIQDEYANSRNFCDGDIFQQIRQSQLAQDFQAESRWLARLSEGKRKDLKQLQRRPELRSLAEALDKLLPYIGFWPSLQIGTFHRVLNLKCAEELQHYLDHVRTCWDRILDDHESLKAQVDYGTVRTLQMRNLCSSADDRDYVTHMMETNQLFPMITDPTLRSRILQRVREIPYIIPSLFTFFEDTKWLEPCAKILRSLLPPGCRESTRDAFFRAYNGSTTRRIQQSPTKSSENKGSEAKNAELGYLQLWMFAWRQFPELSGFMPRKDIGFPKPLAKTSNLQCRYRLAKLAAWLGFELNAISDLLSRDPDMEMACRFLGEARPIEFFAMPSDARHQAAQQICKVLNISWEPIVPQPQRALQSEIALDHRCGRPHEQSHNDSKSHFYFPNIYGDNTKELSYLSINRDIFLAFFGAISGRAHLSEDDEMGDGNINANIPLEVNDQTDHSHHMMAPNSASGVPLDNAMDDEITAPLPNNLLGDTNVAGDGLAALPQSESNTANENLTMIPTQYVVPMATQQQPQPRETGNELQIQGGLDMIRSEAILGSGQNSALYAEWEAHCKEGDLFLVWTTTVQWCHIPAGNVPRDIEHQANDHVFAVQKADRKQAFFIHAKDLSNHVRRDDGDKGSDGVILISPKNAISIVNKAGGATTEARLKNLEDLVRA